MRAAFYRRYGPPEVLEIGELPEPRPAKNEVLVDVIAVGMNPKDAWIRSGAYRLLTGRRFPQQTGSDFSGRVSGSGEPVFGYLNHLRGGAAAERLAVRKAWMAPIPPGLDLISAAALPCAYLTALQALRDRGGLRAGMNVLIFGASGGVGTSATQLARHFGARVTTVSSARNMAYCRDNGAHEALAYDGDAHWAQARPYDIVFKVYAGGLRTRPRLTRRGVFVDLAGNPLSNALGAMQRLLGRPSRASHIVHAERADLELIASLALQGAIRPVVEVLPFEQIREAHARVESAHTVGKIALRL